MSAATTTALRELPILAPVAAPGQGGALPVERAAEPPPDPGLRRPYGAIVAFLLPALVLYAALTAYPFFRTLWNSFHRVLPRREVFVGLDNYTTLAATSSSGGRAQHARLVGDLAALRGLDRAAARAGALRKVPGARFFRVAWFTPVLMSYVVVGILFVWIYNYDWGR
jgi:multiple sugar transport system permease protein/raffinose/stachyose/melibiose transport system permease protein